MDKQERILELANQSADWIKNETADVAERTALARKLFDEIASQLSVEAPETSQITTPNAVVEVVDSQSGYLYRRYLELAYDETDNGLRLFGDDIGGNPVQIVFLSSTALERIHDLQGKGPDFSPCEE